MVDKENPAYPSGCGSEFQVRLNTKTKIENVKTVTNIAEIPFCFISLDMMQNKTTGDKVGNNF